MDDKVHVAFVRYDLSDDYNRHTGAAMASVMENCSKPVVFHILHEEKISFVNREKADENIAKYQELVDKYSCDVYFHNVILPEWINADNIPPLKRFKPTGIYRFYLTEVLPNVDRVVSLGSDVIVKTDLAELLDSVPKNISLIGGRTPLKYVNRLNQHKSKKVKKLITDIECSGVKINDYVNADMLIFNLEKIRREKTLPDIALDYLHKKQNIWELEQSILNNIFVNDIYHLNSRYNIAVGSLDDFLEFVNTDNDNNYKFDDCILHYVNRIKPWDCYLSQIDLEYWYYLRLTPWANNINDFRKYLSYAFHSPKETIINMDELIWSYPLSEKIKLLYQLTFPFYIKLFKRYIRRYIFNK